MIKIEQFIKSCACRSAGECSCNAHAETDAWDALVDQFAAAMKRKFRQKLFEGRCGWDDPECANGIKHAMIEHAHRGLFQEVDVANFAAMLWNGHQP